jgi:hypothetical protein
MSWLPLAVAAAIGPGLLADEMAMTGGFPLQSAVQSLDEPVQVEDVEVFGRRGAALTSPEIELDGSDIDALGAWSVEEVLQRMEESLNLGEEPMVLINGQPTPNLSAYTGFPSDALERAEVLSPEAAGVYGAASGQRVINLVLQSRFSSYDGRLAGSRPTQGGASSVSGDLRRSAIEGRNTHQAGLRLSRDTALRAGERDHYLATEGPDGASITLRPTSDMAMINVNLTRGFGDWSGVFTVSGQTQDSRSIVRSGGHGVETERSSDALAATAGISGRSSGWFLQGNLSGRVARSRESGLQGLENDTRTFALAGSAQRPFFDLPAGAATANLSANFMTSRSDGDRDGHRIGNRFQSADARGTLAIPLFRAGAGSLQGRLIGDLAATFGAGARLDGGEELNAGLTWTPRRSLRLNGEWTISHEGVPEVLRTEPEYFGPPIVVFDFRAGEAVEILPLRGGNPDLQPPEAERLSVMTSLGPFTTWAMSGNLAYQRAQSTNGLGALPGLTEDVEAAFPDHIRRDSDGRIVSIDYRPMNLGSTLIESLNTGFNLNLPRPAGASRGEATVLRIAVNHSFQLSNRVRLRAGLPELDRLKGDGGGLSRQSGRLTIDARRGRWGANVSAQWQEGYRTRRFAGWDDAADLVIAPFGTVDLRFSLQMNASGSRTGAEDESIRRKSGGLQLNLDVENLFDARREARLGDGTAAPGYGRDVQDPLGRTVRLTLQRRF